MEKIPEYLLSLKDQSDTIPCPVCNANDFELLYDGPSLRGNILTCVICKKCTHIYLNPRPSMSAIKEFYKDNSYFQLCAKFCQVSLEEKLRQFKHEEYWKERFDHGRRLYSEYLTNILCKDDIVFDFGCGDGGWLGGLQEATGCQIDGQEISQKYAEVIKDKFNIDIFLGPIEELANPILDKYRGKVKVAIVSGSLQHMLEPMKCLDIAYCILQNDGYLFVCNWNIFDHYMVSYKNREDRRVMGEIFSYEHLHYFHEHSFCYMIENAGFNILNFENESRVRERHMDIFAKKKEVRGEVQSKVGYNSIVSRIRALESATIAQRIRIR